MSNKKIPIKKIYLSPSSSPRIKNNNRIKEVKIKNNILENKNIQD